MAQELLREFFALCEGGICQDLLSESEKLEVKNGAMILSGKIQQADTKNGNGRKYPEKILRREIERYQLTIAENRAMGELDHPESSVVNLKNVSHLVTKTWWEGDAVMAKIRVLDTPSGQILKSLVNSGVKLGISSRGLGSTHQVNGVTMVDDDFQLICFDMVSEPSTPGAYMMKEAKDRQLKVQKNAKLHELLSKINGGKNG
jgi:hypothetical protein